MRIAPELYMCSEHKVCHRCDSTCKTTIATSEGVFCYLTGIERGSVEYLQFDYTHSCTRVVSNISKQNRADRRKRAVLKRVELSCPPSEVAAIIKTLYCDGASRQAAVKHSATRAKLKFRKIMVSRHVELQTVMQIMRVGVSTTPARPGSPMVSAIAIVISQFARALALDILSQAQAAAFPVVFTATVCSKMRTGETIDGVTLIPRVPWLGRHGFNDVHFNQFKISCRGMSSMWRRIKVAALTKQITCAAPVVCDTAPSIGTMDPARRNRYYPVCIN